MCTPKTKIERGVDRLHRRLPVLSDSLKAWATKCFDNYGNAKRFRGKQMVIDNFVIATTKGDWQVVRMFYFYGTYKYKKLVDVEIIEVMQEWYNHGKYVFYSRNRGMGYCVDGWTSQDMSIKRGIMGGYILSDPRNLGCGAFKVIRLTNQFKYVPMDTGNDIRDVFRAVATDKYAEVVLRKCPMHFNWCYHRVFTMDTYTNTSPDAVRISAIKVALRHGYDVNNKDWEDHIDLLHKEGFDTHNPHYICPSNLAEAHQALLAHIEKKKKEEEKERCKRMKRQYVEARNKFFGIIIEGKGLEIKCLQSVEEFCEEGKAMHHCVFRNEYYDMQQHPDSLILSAKHDGKRVETIEVNLKTYEVAQSRAKCNGISEYHCDILELMNKNMDVIKTADKARRMAV